MDQDVTYGRDIRPLFRDGDVESMSFAFDLSSYEDVRDNAEATYDRLDGGTMPCDGRGRPRTSPASVPGSTTARRRRAGCTAGARCTVLVKGRRQLR